jgi:uncharacterized protein (DUF2141 family)
VTKLAAIVLALTAAAAPASAQVRVFGSDAAACVRGLPAIRADITDLMDRTGSVKLEVYPANDTDFLKHGRELRAQGKFYRRIKVPTPAAGPVSLCIRVPRPGRYALLFTHDRDGRDKFNFWSDGAGFPSNVKIRRMRPTLAMAAITVPQGVVVTRIRAQYLRGIAGFKPLPKRASGAR